MAGTYELAKVGDTNASAGPKWVAQFEGMNNKLNSSNLLEDSGLASPNNSCYRTLLSVTSILSNALVASTYLLGSYAAGNPSASGANLLTGTVPWGLFYMAKADCEVAGKTQKLRLRSQFSTNATKPTQTFTPGLYPITVAGGANELKLTLGTVVTGSNAGSAAEPTASTVTSKETSDFTIPADGLYCLGLVTSGTLTANSTLAISAQLQTRSV